MAKTEPPIIDRIRELQEKSLADLAGIADLEALEAFRVKWLGRKGALTDILRGVSEAPSEDRPALGRAANEVKVALTSSIAEKKAALASAGASQAAAGQADFSLPGRRAPRGHLHLISQLTNEIVDIFSELGYQVATGPDIETEYYNFDALNTPADHPARDSHDTFYIKPGVVLRTHTSPVQMRVMEKVQPPVAIVAPGRAYRVDYDATHSPMFFQVEGLLVDEGVTFADLKGTLHHFIHRLFGKEVRLRFRPHFFPFTEPSAEVDILWTAKDRHTGEVQSRWLEILGCGMVHPEVFRYAGYDYEKYTGFAFGMGIERIAMVRHSIPNIHYLYENDLRFLEQF